MTSLKVPKKCPYCGSSNVSILKDKGSFQVFCSTCYLYGPKDDTEEEAVASWNSVVKDFPERLEGPNSCPYCQNSDVFLYKEKKPGGHHYVYCSTCNAFGPTGYSNAEAIMFWNSLVPEKSGRTKRCKPCLYCKSNDICVEIIESSDRTYSIYLARCRDCQMQGPETDSEEGAIEAWNFICGKGGKDE